MFINEMYSFKYFNAPTTLIYLLEKKTWSIQKTCVNTILFRIR